jgi:nitroreductase
MNMNTLTAIATRRSIRKYLSKQIDGNDLNTILGAGSSAPVALGNYSNIHFTVIQNKAILAQLADEPEGKAFYGAPTLILISAAKTPYPNIEFFNAGCALENMFLAATSLGLGSVFISRASDEATSNSHLLASLNLPDGYAPVAAVAIGHPLSPLTELSDFKNGVSINWLS